MRVYVPGHFREDDTGVLAALVRDNAFALLVSAAAEGLQATHLPLLLDVADDGTWRLTGHVARANPHWRALAPGVASLAVFSGAHGYVSPRWYVSPQMVPTWNYVAVHAGGELAVFEDRDRLRGTVARLSAVYESGAAQPWSPETLDPARLDTLLGAIVGIEMRVVTVTGKHKLGQNRSRADREGVVAGLADRGDDNSRLLAALVERTLDAG